MSSASQDSPNSSASTSQFSEVRLDPTTGSAVHIVGTRQGRPNLPASGCPFCVGGIEAPDHYDVLSFPNRWPAMDGDRCEVVLYTPDHEATFWSLGAQGARRVIDLWADRTAALGGRDDVDYVLIFENRGAEVGATISHPHGQIYAFDHVPARQARHLAGPWTPDADPGDRLVCADGTWQVYVPWAPRYPVELSISPLTPRPDLPSLSEHERDGLAAVLVDILGRLDRLYDQPIPYMMWLNQRPAVADGYADAWFNIEIVSPWRAAGVFRF